MSDSSSMVFSPMAVRKVIGILGTSLPFILAIGGLFIFDFGIQRTVSLYYHTDMRDVFVGMLFAISVGLLTYRGYDWRDNVFTNVASVLAIGVALFPTDADPDVYTTIGTIHLVCAGGFFAVLIYIAGWLFTKSKNTTPRKRLRNRIYKLCACFMAGALLLMFTYYLLPEDINAQLRVYNPVFYLEALAIAAFGFAWLVKGGALLKDKSVSVAA